MFMESARLSNTAVLRPQPTRRTGWKLVGNPGSQPGLAISFQLVRLVGCGLYGTRTGTGQTDGRTEGQTLNMRPSSG